MNQPPDPVRATDRMFDATKFLGRTLQEVERAQKKHAPMHSLHEGYAILLEEVDELWDEIKKSDHDLSKVLAELTQVAAMATRIYVDVLAAEARRKPDTTLRESVHEAPL